MYIYTYVYIYIYTYIYKYIYIYLQSNFAFRISIVKSDVDLSLKEQSDCWLSVWGGAFEKIVNRL